jgi:hypothetical protein
MEDEFNSLAMKELAGKSTPEESRQLEELMDGNPELKLDFEAMRKEFPAAMDLFSMIPDSGAEKEEMPEYVRNLLQGEVQRTFGDQQRAEQERLRKKEQSALGLLWKFALAGGLCVCVLTISGVQDCGSKGVDPGGENPTGTTKLDPVINLAVLDFIGPLRGGEGDPVEAAFKEAWPNLEPKKFSETPESEKWSSGWDLQLKAPQVKVLYNLSEGSIEVTGYYNGETKEKSIELMERAPAEVLKEIQELVAEWYGGD